MTGARNRRIILDFKQEQGTPGTHPELRWRGPNSVH